MPENVEIRKNSKTGERWFDKEQKKALYGFLDEKTYNKWIEDNLYASFVICHNKEEVGGISFTVYDIIETNGGNITILDVAMFFIKKEYRGKYIDRIVFKEIPRIKEYYLRKYSLNVKQIHVETSTASSLYDRVFPTLGYPFQRTETEVAGKKIVYYFINVE
jgi:hypothetical protein